MISYHDGTSSQIIVLTHPVLAHFDRFRQIAANSSEAGGQLFAGFRNTIIRVELATGPRASDYRSRSSFIPNRAAERREIRRISKDGLHYVGDWHTHPELIPVPSQIDITSFQDMYRKSRHRPTWFVMVIVGTAAGEEGLYVALCNDRETRRLAVLDSTG